MYGSTILEPQPLMLCSLSSLNSVNFRMGIKSFLMEMKIIFHPKGKNLLQKQGK